MFMGLLFFPNIIDFSSITFPLLVLHVSALGLRTQHHRNCLFHYYYLILRSFLFYFFNILFSYNVFSLLALDIVGTALPGGWLHSWMVLLHQTIPHLVYFFPRLLLLLLLLLHFN